MAKITFAKLYSITATAGWTCNEEPAASRTPDVEIGANESCPTVSISDSTRATARRLNNLTSSRLIRKTSLIEICAP